MASKNFHPGNAIRDLRIQRGLTGEELGRKAGLSQPKVSRIESGATTHANPLEIEKILHILNAPQLIQQQILSAFELPNAPALRRLKLHYPFEEAYTLDKSTRLRRSVSIGALPALLQTPEYRLAYLSRQLSKQDIQTAMRVVTKRQDLLWDLNHRFHFILHEALLYTRPSSRMIQVGQLDRIERFIGLPNIKIGIIPLEAGIPIAENCSFVIHDENCITQMVINADIVTHNPDDIAIHLKIFNMFDQLADYGDSARTIIHKAIDYFS